MSLIRNSGVALALGLCALAPSAPVVADIWVFEPSITLDQRFDDNYFLIPAGSGSLSATRAVGELGLSREAENYVLKGLVRVDALLTTNTDVGEEDLDSNQIAALDARKRTARSRYGVRVNFKNDTPSRDIAADLSDSEAIAEDTGLLVTQSLSSNVARQEITIEPQFCHIIVMFTIKMTRLASWQDKFKNIRVREIINIPHRWPQLTFIW